MVFAAGTCDGTDQAFFGHVWISKSSDARCVAAQSPRDSATGATAAPWAAGTNGS